MTYGEYNYHIKYAINLQNGRCESKGRFFQKINDR